MEKGILPNEGLKILDLILENESLTQVIVSTGDLNVRQKDLNKLNMEKKKNNSFRKKKVIKNKYKRPDLANAYVAPISNMEKELASIFEDVLGFEKVGLNDNMFELGGDSLLAIQIISSIQEEFLVDISLSVLFDNSTIEKLASFILKAKAEDSGYIEKINSLPEMQVNLKDKYEPFSLTELQQAYWVGRNESFEMGNVATHAYFEFDSDDFDINRFEKAWNKMINRHDMLRAIVLESGNQKILEEVPEYKIKVTDLNDRSQEEIDDYLAKIRKEMSHQILKADRWPLFDIRETVSKNKNIRIHFSIDGLLLDGWSYQILFKELIDAYKEPEKEFTPLTISFRDYVLTKEKLTETDYFKKSKKYWMDRLPKLPPQPDLPLAKSPEEINVPKFTRLEYKMEKKLWNHLKSKGAKLGLTPTGILLSAYACIIALWSKNKKFTINVPRFDRLPFHEQVNDLIGEFASFSFLEVDMSKNESFSTIARRIQEQIWKDLENRYVSGVEITRDLYHLKGDLSSSRMPIVFTEFPKGREGRNSSLESSFEKLGNSVYSITQTSQVWIDNQIHDWNDGLYLNWDVVNELFPENMVEDMFEVYSDFLNKLAIEEEIWNVDNLNLIPSKQLTIRKKINEKELIWQEKSLMELLKENYESKKNNKAIISANKNLTYEELFQYADKLSGKLCEIGANPNDFIGIIMEKGWEQIASVLGILQTGAVYVPIDSEQPKDRIKYILEDSEINIVLTQSNVYEKLGMDLEVKVINVDDEDSYINCKKVPEEKMSKLDDLAYIIYTSGSTGRPKGVMIRQKGVINSILYTNGQFNINSKDKVLSLTALHHDMSVFDIFGILHAGGAIVLPEAKKRKEPVHWVRLIRDTNITVWNTVPAMMEMLMEYLDTQDIDISTLRLAFMGGDWIHTNLPDRIRKYGNPNMQIVSVGGPTETTLWNIWYVIKDLKKEWKSIPYGEPIANAKYYVLNEKLQDCPEWVPGVLYCSGMGVTKGYLNDENKTKEKIIMHPENNEVLYCTGDMGRYMKDGNIEFLGRMDYQFNILGFRVEPEEIETVLKTNPKVRNAVVDILGNKKENYPILNAYIMLKSKEDLITIDELQSYLREYLPEYMVPKKYIFLESFPLSNNGKIDRKKLKQTDIIKDLQIEIYDKKETKEIGTDLYYRILKLVKETVKLPEAIESKENLMNYGINSVDIIRIFNSMEKEFKIRPDMYEFFTNPTINYLYEFYKSNTDVEEQKIDTTNQGISEVDKLITSFKTILDVDERDKFRSEYKSIRKIEPDSSIIKLGKIENDKKFEELYFSRKSYRKYSNKPISFKSFSYMLESLHARDTNGKLKFMYAAAGGLYAVQVYVHIKMGKVESLEEGVYYYNPRKHALEAITLNVEISPMIHTPFLNRPLYENAGFSIYLIGEIKAIAPLYGDMSMHFMTMEAGSIAHQLEFMSYKYDIGLCQIGSIEFDQVEEYFKLSKTQVLIHSLIGGNIKDVDTEIDTDESISNWVEVEI
ncbi:non-ribosomal peptide synthetase [Clostridium botulinum]|uniref:non-ribosomal peptide synthetase n=1 Tax=Clostridium botulinum TaxID=1491 RepID=UPI00067C744F|nr:non-ribosomal peptide synthetase [Clostridium botulinum]